MKITLLLFLGILTTSLSTPVSLDSQVLIEAVIDGRQSTPDYRLNGNVVPIHYDLHLTPYFETEGTNAAFTFDGVIKISVRVTNPTTSNIVLLANRLQVADDWLVYPENDRNNPILRAMNSYDEVTHKLTLHLNRALNPDVVYVIEMNYLGEMASDMYGFYRTYYTEGGQTKWLGSTQFQATSARRAYPCFDEPKFKATFQLTMERPGSFSPTVSNTRIESSTAGIPDGRIREVFGKTPIMSSYLLAFVVSEYTGRNNTANNQATFSRPNAFEQTSYAVSFADAVLNHFDTYTGYPYLSVDGIDKLDQAAIPDFSAGAMENWGLMTYRETMVLVDPLHTTTLQKQRIAAVISHEIVHQWFGDLVTCDWWDNTWLNEGFATFFQYFGTHWVENLWELDLQFVVEQYQSAFQMDSLVTTHPMTNPVNSPAQVSANFNNINYNKAGSVLRMLEHIVGAENFKMALQDYLRNNAFGNTLPGHLWAALQAHSALQIGRVIDPWVTQPGYPYITVTVDGTSVSVTQKRFLVKNKDHSDDSTWPIAMSYATVASEFSNTLPQQIFYKEDGEAKNFTLTTAPQSYFIVNNQQTGYYRVNYDNENWMRIKNALNSEGHGNIHVLNRAQIVDDLFNFARAGIVEYNMAIDILEYIKTERSYTPWLAFFNGLTYVTRRIVGEAATEEFEYFVNDLLSEIYDDLGYVHRADDTHTQILLRNHVLTWLCRYEHEGCLENSRAEWAQMVAAPTTYSINPDHRAIVYCQALREGGEAEFNLLWSRYRTANVAHEQITIINAMGCTASPDLLRTFLDTVLTDEVRYQDKQASLTSALAGNPQNVDTVFQYLTANYVNWANNFGFNGMGAVASALSATADRFTTSQQVSSLTLFVSLNQASLGVGPTQTIRNAVTEAEWQIEWGLTNAPSVLDFLQVRRSSATTVTASILFSMILALLVYTLN